MTDFNTTNVNGFTLIELIVTLAILAIVTTMGSIALTHVFKSIESKTICATLINFLTSAKQDALIYQNAITVCLANDRLACVSTGGSQAISFIDKNNNHVFDASTEKLNHQIKLDLSWGKLSTNVASNRTYIVFKPENARPIGYMGNIQYCPLDGNTTHQFKVSFSITGIIKHKPYLAEPFTCA